MFFKGIPKAMDFNTKMDFNTVFWDELGNPWVPGFRKPPHTGRPVDPMKVSPTFLGNSSTSHAAMVAL